MSAFEYIIERFVDIISWMFTGNKNRNETQKTPRKNKKKLNFFDNPMCNR